MRRAYTDPEVDLGQATSFKRARRWTTSESMADPRRSYPARCGFEFHPESVGSSSSRAPAALARSEIHESREQPQSIPMSLAAGTA